MDLLVTFDDSPLIAELLEMAGEVEEIIGAPVDFLLRPYLERSPNRFARDHILSKAVCLYEEHIVIKNFSTALDQMVDKLKHHDDVTAKKLTAFLNIDRKWILPNQAQGVINVKDLAAVTGEEGVHLLRSILPR